MTRTELLAEVVRLDVERIAAWRAWMSTTCPQEWGAYLEACERHEAAYEAWRKVFDGQGVTCQAGG